MVIGATLFIANNQVGGFLVAGAVLLQALTVDNYLLQQSETTQTLALQNMLKDAGVVAAALLVALKSTQIVHRKQQFKGQPVIIK